MKKYIIFLPIFFLVLFAIFVTTSCSWHLYNGFKKVSNHIKIIVFNSYDPNNSLSLIIRNQFQLNGIKLINKNFLDKNIPSLNILASNLCQETVSVFLDGKTAEYQIILTIKANIVIPKNGIYPINTKVYRTFFNNSQTALSKCFQQRLIIHEIYREAAEELIHKLFIFQVNKTKHHYIRQ